ncbi:Crp/Fnr family transcriptional regulator [Novisyntrophococcus fermenticellae]|uniref:Crp/Fnr family transcriptional regulator n=1 Tax=Novisyntrophococcus fermenticellae TaxID=2068655 RepID=UPI001E5EF6BA|nr:Crp/Fnr family transcriptional regulator [Novisyntrophococcus fermenticellae]
MDASMKVLQRVPLFRGINENDFPHLLNCINAKKKSYARNEFIFLSGDIPTAIGIVLDGRVQIIKEDVFGNRVILNDLGAGAVFGESFVCGGSFSLTVSVQATEDSSILLCPFKQIMHICPNACEFHNTLVQNMVVMVSQHNIKLLEQLEVTTKHSLREKILAYLAQLAQEQDSATVNSPLGRVDLADYLGVDRSSLTRELKRMQDEHILQFDKNIYTLLNTGI